MKQSSVFKRYGFVWVAFAFFTVSLAFHWLFGWYAYIDERHALCQSIKVSGYVVEMLRDTFENWQSEFLQLIWQVAGFAMLLYVGSPQSKEGDDRMEAKLDIILSRLDPRTGQALIDDIDRK